MCFWSDVGINRRVLCHVTEGISTANRNILIAVEGTLKAIERMVYPSL